MKKHVKRFLAIMLVVVMLVGAFPVFASAANTTTDNKWDVLVLIYKKVQTNVFNKSFTDSQINATKTVVSDFPKTIKNLSNSRMLINSIDTYVIADPITHVSNADGYAGYPSVGPGKDIDLTPFLESKFYNEVIIFAPLSDYPGEGDPDWTGLGGVSITYKSEPVYYVVINNSLSSRNGTVYGTTYNIGTAAMVHETLHSVERNSDARGWTSYQELHSAGDNGYTDENEWFAWYHDLMQDTLGSGKRGFIPKSFYVNHPNSVSSTVSGSLPVLKQGGSQNTVKRVKTLQRMLIAKGYSCGSCGADGDFGSNTRSAVIRYQQAKGLSVDGIVGKDTWTKLLLDYFY